MKSGVARILRAVPFILALLVTGIAANNQKPEGEPAGVGGTTLYFPFVNNGDDLLTTFALFNRTPTATTGTIAFFDDTGLPMPLVINGQPAQTVINFSLPPRGRIDLTTTATGELQTGSARVSSPGQIGGFSSFGHSFFCPGGTGPSVGTAAFGTPVRNRAGTMTLLAITNVDSAPTTLQVRLYNNDGTLAGMTNTGIGANGRIARNLNALFPGADNFQGSLVVTATGGRVAAVAIDINPATMMFIMLPVTPIAVSP